MTLAAPMLGNGAGLGAGRARATTLPPQAALVCEVATCPASLLPVGPLFGLSACLAACGVRRSPHLAQYSPGAALLMGLAGNRPSAWFLGVCWR